MKRNDRARIVYEVLNELYPNPAIPLDHEDPYTLLIAVLLSAQCTDKRVNLVTPHLFAKAKTPEEMVRLSVDEIEEIIRTCGLSHNKAKAIKSLSQILINHHGGAVPTTFEELEALPGVGHKTASVVMAQAFNVPAFPVDTHIHRSAKRWKLSKANNVVQTEKDLKKLYHEDDWNALHLQIIYFAREHCPAKGHDPRKCPICSKIEG